MVIDRKIPTLWRAAELLSQKYFFQHWTPLTVFVASVKCHLRYLIHCSKILSDGLECREAVWAVEKHRCCSIFQLMDGSGCSAGACPALCGHQGSSQLCAIAAATFYFPPLWRFPPLCCFEFCCCCYKTCPFSNSLCPSGPRLLAPSGTAWWALKLCRTKQSLVSLPCNHSPSQHWNQPLPPNN